MNKEKLLELSDTLRGIAEGKEWEYRGIDWFKPLKDPMYYIRQNIQVRLKPQPPPPDPYAALKAAHAAGKTIQYKYGSGSYPDYPDWGDLSNPEFSDNVSTYRIKPELQKLPLSADDVKAGAQFLSKCGQIWFPNHIREGYVCFGHFMSLTFQELIDDGWKIRCAGETEWRPCYKLVEQ